MERLSIVFLFCSLILIGTQASSDHEYLLPIQKLPHGKESVINLHFYIQDLVGGENQTVWEVAQSNISTTLPSRFGRVIVVDDLLTSGPELDSEEVGRLQGILAYSDLNEIAQTMVVNVVFTSGPYTGSTLSILGRNPFFVEERELPVVGGTGVFRMARGYSISRILYISADYNLYESNVFVSFIDGDAVHMSK